MKRQRWKPPGNETLVVRTTHGVVIDKPPVQGLFTPWLGKNGLMWRNVLTGIVAGTAGTTALNAVSFMDMAVRARPTSTTPADTVHKTEQLLGLGSAEDRRNGTGADR